MNEICINLFRLTKMPEIDKISCRHSGSDKDGVYLFGLRVETMKHYGSDDPIDRQYIVQKYILRENRFLNTINKCNLNEEQFSEMVRIPHNVITRTELTYYQIIWILFVVFTLFAYISLMIQTNLDAYNWSTFLITILTTLAIGGFIGGAFIFLLKYLNKSIEIQTVLMNSTQTYNCLKFLLYLMTFLVLILLQRSIVINGTAIDPFQALYWLSATLFVSSVFASLWLLSNELQKMSAQELQQSLKEQSNSETQEKSVSLSNTLSRSESI